jgi:hypothetical protein
MKEGKSKLTLRNERIVGYTAISIQTGVMMVMFFQTLLQQHRVFNNVHLVMLREAVQRGSRAACALVHIVYILAAAQRLLLLCIAPADSNKSPDTLCSHCTHTHTAYTYKLLLLREELRRRTVPT